MHSMWRTGGHMDMPRLVTHEKLHWVQLRQQTNLQTRLQLQWPVLQDTLLQLLIWLTMHWERLCMR